jgi:UDP-N-acetylmuramoyl-tripeptide--D-alanyl-D-alanine ligase
MAKETLVARWTAGGIAGWIDAEVVGDPAAVFVAVTTDSREAGEGTAFFALDGARQRGSQFVPDAFGAGCSVVVVPMEWRGDIPPGRAALRCADPEGALARLASRVRDSWTGPVLAVTGSVGKTTVKEMIATVLEPEGRLLRSPGNFNTVVGLARTLLDFGEDGPDAAVLEVGASRRGEISRLGAIVRPTAAAVTNVSPAHLEGFGGIADVRREKLDLLRAVPADGLRVVDGDDAALVAEAREIGPVVTVGFGSGNDLVAEGARLDGDGVVFRVRGGPEVRLAVPGMHQAKNALFALAMARAQGVDDADTVGRLATFRPVAGRLVLRDWNGVTVADDTYNANPTSMRAALSWFFERPAAGRRIVALGDMRELGAESRRWHEELGALVAECGPDFAVFVGKECRAASEVCRKRLGDQCRWTESPEEAARILRHLLRSGDALLVKGSRGVRMEGILQSLETGGDAHAG